MITDRIPLDCPFSLPLGWDEFSRSLHTGHGRALMHVRRCGAAGVEDLTLDACVHNMAFDAQCEGERATWMMEIIDAAGLEHAACERVAAALTRPATAPASRHTYHMYQLALRFAQRGSDAARTVLYAAFDRDSIAVDPVGGKEIIELDGAEGLLFVAQRIGQRLAADPNLKTSAWPLRCYDGRDGDGAAERLLRAAAEHDSHIATYLARMLPAIRHARDPRPDPPGMSGWKRPLRKSADELIRDIESDDPRMSQYRSAVWGVRACDDALRQVAERLFLATDPAQLVRFLRVFSRRGLPQFNLRLIRLAHHPEREVRWMATRVLAHHTAPAVRVLALNRLRAGHHDLCELNLFRNNYQPGDWTLIRESLQWPEDECDLHWMLMDVLKIYESNREESREPMLLVYEQTPCSLCRGRALEALLEARMAPAWLIEECRSDAAPEIRKAV